MSEPTCSGKCCAVFTYSVPLSTLRERDGEEAKFLVDMLIELSPEQAQERAERFGISGSYGESLVVGREFPRGLYTCRHWDEETRLCGVYGSRPRMCRDYPYARTCDHDDCCQYRPPYAIQIRYMPRVLVWEGDYA